MALADDHVADVTVGDGEAGDVDAAERLELSDQVVGALHRGAVVVGPRRHRLFAGGAVGGGDDAAGERALLAVEVLDDCRGGEALPVIVGIDGLGLGAQPVEPKPRADREIDGANFVRRPLACLGRVDDMTGGGQRIEAGDAPRDVLRYAIGGQRFEPALQLLGVERGQYRTQLFGQQSYPGSVVLDRRGNVQRLWQVAQEPERHSPHELDARR